ncbi:MAG: hypothetical protein DMD81_06085 [Candidatus Rokuibacteriota bacterium]|nr:MAG: hypothetical protein DMD81_06085 [Candidatus Rokubacteria bacterium]
MNRPVLAPPEQAPRIPNAFPREVRERLRSDDLNRVLNAALEAVAAGIVITDRNGVITQVNPAFTKMTGWEAAEIIGRTPSFLKSGVHDDAFYAALWDTILAGRVWQGQIVNRRKDGSLYTEEQTITPVFAPDGRLTHFVASKHDVSDRERLTQQLHEREAHYRSLIESVLDVIIVIDTDGTIRYGSPSMQRVLGHAPNERTGRPALELVHPDDQSLVRMMCAACLDDPAFVGAATYRLQHRDGSWRVMEAVGKSFVYESVVHGVVVTARDVTERRRAEETQARLREQLMQREKLAALGELLAGVAHELNNPLSVVLGHIDLLRATAKGSIAVRAEKMSSAAERCTRIVRNFLTLARQHPQERARVAVGQVVEEALELVAYPLRVDGIRVTLDLPEDLPLVFADPHQLHQVFLNLVTNAHQALRSATGPRQITVSSKAESDGMVCIEVSDTGPGIADDIASRIFEPFFTTKPLGQGTGLGLPICKGIVEAHGGTLTVEGRPGVGACFRVRLPIGESDGALDGGASSPPLSEEGKAILVVDDEPAVAGMLEEMLTRSGFRVQTAGNGREALEHLRQRSYDMVLSDVRMPELDGIGLYREVEREIPALRRRFAFITGDTLNNATDQFLAATRLPCLSKPFTIDAALSVIAMTLTTETTADSRA